MYARKVREGSHDGSIGIASSGTGAVLQKQAPQALAEPLDYGEMEGDGFQGTTSQDFGTPWLSILQSNSPEVSKSNNKHIEGAEEGMIFDNVTRELYSGEKGVVIIPCFTTHQYNEWVPRDAGGGFVASHEIDSKFVEQTFLCNKTKFGKLQTPDGKHELIETFTIYAMMLTPDGNIRPYLIAMTSSQIKSYKSMMNTARAVMVPNSKGVKKNPPLYAHRYRFTTEPRQNDDYSWFVFKIELDGKNATEARLRPGDALLIAANKFCGEAKLGNVKMAERSEQAEDGPSGGGGAADEEEGGF